MASFQEVDPELAAFRAKFGGPMMGLDQPGGILTGTPQAVQSFKSGIPAALGRFFENRPENVLIQQGGRLPSDTTAGVTSALSRIRDKLAGAPPEDHAGMMEKLSNWLGFTKDTLPNADVLIRMKPGASSVMKMHEGLHGAYALTKGQNYAPERFDSILNSLPPPRIGQPNALENIIQRLAENMARLHPELGGFSGLSP